MGVVFCEVCNDNVRVAVRWRRSVGIITDGCVC